MLSLPFKTNLWLFPIRKKINEGIVYAVKCGNVHLHPDLHITTTTMLTIMYTIWVGYQTNQYAMVLQLLKYRKSAYNICQSEN